jgi:cbb3-type cytochrome oxidase subunit 3
MKFLKAFLKNLVFLLLLGVILWILFPDQMSEVFNLYGTLFGPVAILLVVAFAFPRKRRQ